MWLLRSHEPEIRDRGSLGGGTTQATLKLADGGALLDFFQPMRGDKPKKGCGTASGGWKGLLAGIVVQGDDGASYLVELVSQLRQLGVCQVLA
jgi:hypothetical protein